MEATQEPRKETETKDPRTDPTQTPTRERRWWEYPFPLFSRPTMAIIGAAGLIGAAALAAGRRMARKAESSRDGE